MGCGLSCRHAGWGGEATLDEAFLRLDVRPLDGGRVNDLVRLWFSAARRALAVHPDERVAAERRAAREAQALIDRLGEPDQAAQRLLALVSVPLLLTLLCLVVLRGGEIPRRRSKFYEQCLEVLLGRWRESRGIRPLLPVEDALDLLRPVAYQLHEAGRRDDLTAAEFSEWTGELTEAIGRAAGRELTPARVLDWLHVGAGVLAEYAPDRYGFSHLGFQEYLAALHVGREGGGLPGELAGHFGEEWWREVMLLLQGQPTYPVFGRFARHLAGRPVEEHPELLRRCLDEAHRPEAGAFAAALRGRKVPNRRKAALLRAFVGRQEPAVEAAAEGLVDSRDADVRALACQLLGREPTPLPAAAAAEAVREEPWTEPETGIRFLWVPGGEYEMGGKAVTKASLPAHRVRVSPFWLAETPVTNGQYGSFLEATGHAEPEYWRDGRFSDATQPVVGVSWADAEAFCAWLADLAGRPVGLPSEAQWERAARGEDGRRYPWGDGEPDAARACFAGSSKGRPDPVGTHPAGRGPFGHLDLAGNVWEWCADVWDAEAYRRRAGKEPELNPVVTQGDEARRALRGGSWDNAAAGLHAACRGGDHAGARWRYCGFRVSSSPASTVD